MDEISAAVGDLRLSLEVAAAAYRRFADQPSMGEERSFLGALSSERNLDAIQIQRAAMSAELDAEPLLGEADAAETMELTRVNPTSPRSIAYRVQRAENILSDMTAQLHTVTEDRALRIALGIVRERIDNRRADVRKMRQTAASLEPLERNVAGGFAQIEEAEGYQVTVWFGSNRALNRAGKFIGERGNQVRYGRCKVFIPSNHQIGSTGSIWLKRIFRGDDRIKVTATETLTDELFWTEIGRELRSIKIPHRHALVFLHGYCVKFEDAARRTAQIKADLGYHGPAAFFSWPSRGAILGYAGDRAAIEASEAEIRQFLVDFSTRTGAEAVHIIAHSMGNQGLLRVMDAIAHDAAASARVRFGQIILAAPDVDRKVFTELASAYVRLSKRSTLYVSENDRPVGWSARGHRFDRVGKAPPVTVVPGIDTINVSKVNLGLLGHSYVAELRTILTDIYSLLTTNTPPHKQFGLHQIDGPEGSHWEFMP